MSGRQSRAGRGSPWVPVAGLVALVVIVAALVVFAVTEVGKVPVTDRTVAPVPSFGSGSQPSVSPSAGASASPSGSPAPAASSEQRLLAISGATWWRATRGECGGTAPTLGRSTDRGASWADVTPSYRNVTEIFALVPFAGDQAEIIATIGTDCTVQGLRTFTDGRFWEPNAQTLASLAYVDRSSAITAAGDTVAAPCATPLAADAAASALAVLCADGVYARTGASVTFTRLPGAAPVALSVSSTGIAIARTTPSCTGVTLERFTFTALGTPAASICRSDLATPGAIAIADAGDSVGVWTDRVSVIDW